MQFLDLAGLQELWAKIKAGDAAARTTLTEQGASEGTAAEILVVKTDAADGHYNYALSLNRVASPTDITTAINALKGDASSTGDTLGKLEDRVEGLETGASVTIQEAANPGDYAKVYNFTQNGQSIGSVNIPKDFLVKSGSVREIGSSEATQEMPEGTKVLDFVVNTIGGDGTDSHILIPVNELVDVYTAGNGIAVSSTNVISAVVDPAVDNEFLSVSAAGLKVSGVSTAISDAVNAAKAELKGTKADGDTTAETIRGAKDYADSIVAAKNVTASGETGANALVEASASGNAVSVNSTTKLQNAVGYAESALQGVDSTPAGTNVQVTLGKDGKNVTVAVDEAGLTSALAGKVDKVEGSSLMTQAEHEKLAAIEADADVNVIEAVKVNGTALPVNAADKSVNIDLSGKADKVVPAASGNLAALDNNGNLTDSGKSVSDFATSADGALAQSAIQSVTGETDITGGNDELVAVTASTNASHAVTLVSKVKTQAVATAVASTTDGLATAADVKSYVDGKTTIAAHTESAAAPSGTTPTGTMVVSSVTTENGGVTAVGSVEVEAAGAAAAVESKLRGASDAPGYSATETLAALRSDINAISGGGEGSISEQIQDAIEELNSDVNAATATTNHVTSTNTNTTTSAATTPVVNVLTSLTINNGIITAATGETIGAIPKSSLDTVLV